LRNFRKENSFIDVFWNEGNL